MCGIAGIMALDGRAVSADSLRAMTQCMVQRGPDDDGFVTRGAIGLGFRRLSIIDVAGGHQPLTNEAGDLQLVLNGEIYNHVELRGQLEARGHRFHTHSDAEVVLHLYEEQGTEALAALNGMFAFALMDERRGSLWIARDRLGIKPLFYSITPGTLAFASDIHALRAAVPTEVDPSLVLSYLALGYAPGAQSLWRGVQKLLPGHYLLADAGGVTTRRYWSIDPARRWDGTVEQAALECDALLVDAVRMELRSDVPLGVFLSGGLDSSAIVALAAEQVVEPLRTFTIAFEGKVGSSDVRFSRAVAEHYRTSHTELSMTAADGAMALDEMMPLLDEPIADSGIIAAYWLSRAARADGIKVLLNGAGGDEIFGGYGRHHPADFASPRWVADRVPAMLRPYAAAAMGVIHPARGARAHHPALAWASTVNGADLHNARQLLRSREQVDVMHGAIMREYSMLEGTDADRGFTYRRMHLDLATYLPNDVLSLIDKATMAVSVEGRVPLIDHRLVEFAFSLPEDVNILDGQQKGLFKKVLKNRLPHDLLHRRKEGFNAPSDTWLQHGHGFDVRGELLGARTTLVDELVSASALEKVLATPESRRESAPLIFSLYFLNRWHRAHSSR
jgi:asparagine synthase (glutamine-hydrolysing)